MDFKDQIALLSARVGKMKEAISTEEATKNAFIMHFLQTMGYNIFNPLEVVPEYIADIGIWESGYWNLGKLQQKKLYRGRCLLGTYMENEIYLSKLINLKIKFNILNTQ